MDDRAINRRTLAVIDVISSWTVNTFYNYLHQQAVTIHTSGRSASITDGYKFIVKQYLDSFNTSEGYRRNLMGLHKYYIDNTRYSSVPFDVWIKDILQQFVPGDYFPIMSNSQQDITLRNILVNAIQQFSSDVICTKLIDNLITNHEHASIVPIMKESMRRSLLFERQRLFQAVFKSSTGSQDKPMELMKKELATLIEENVSLTYKNKKAVTDLKKALDGMKIRDNMIADLQNELTRTRAQLRVKNNQAPIKMPSPEETFITAVSSATGLRQPNSVLENELLVDVSTVDDNDDEKTAVEFKEREPHTTQLVEETDTSNASNASNASDRAQEEEEESFITSSSDDLKPKTQGDETTLSLDMADFLDS